MDWRLKYFAELDSTMHTAARLAKEGEPEGLVIVADQQTSAYGRRGNAWVAPKGNLYCSIIIRPDITVKDSGQISFLISVALGDVIEKLLQPPNIYQNKWPNDGLINGKKFAGILLENGLSSDNTLLFLNVGVGVNLVSAPEGKMALNMVAPEISRDEFLNRFLERLGVRLDEYKNQGFSRIRRDWLQKAKGINDIIQVRLPHETLSGIFTGLDENGALLLGLDNGTQKVIHSGEVFFGPVI